VVPLEVSDLLAGLGEMGKAFGGGGGPSGNGQVRSTTGGVAELPSAPPDPVEPAEPPPPPAPTS
jgi:hypothetical protein